MAARIAYVNVQGLSRASWEAVCHLLSTQCDLLFVAETWFVDHERYRRDARVVASTPKSDPAPHRPGRHHPG